MSEQSRGIGVPPMIPGQAPSAGAPPTEQPTPAPKPDPKKVPYTFRGEGNGLYQRASWVFGRTLSRIISVLMFRLRVSGQAHIPTRGGALMITNHQSFLDPWLLGIAMQRQLHYMARDSLFKGGFLHYVLELWNSFPVKRGTADLTAIRTAVERLDQGFIVNIFPEGTRSEDGSIAAIAPGMSLILNRCKTDVVIIPTVIDGAFEAWPRQSKFPHPHDIRIHHGKPIQPSEWRALSPEDLAKKIRQDLINIQKTMHSPHTQKSQQRLNQEAANPSPTRRRR